jgi:hypothetical protein
MENTQEKLIPFLRNLADSIERKKLEPKLLESIQDFSMSYQFQEQAVKDADTSESSNLNREDLIKFFTFGWYVYKILLRNETL